MQKYLLLLLMCLVGTIEMHAGIKVTSAGSGSYILTFTNTTDGTIDWDSLDDNENANVKSATSLKIVTEGDYKLTTTDMQYIMGNDEAVGSSAVSSVFGSTLKNLDMIDAELSNYNDLKFMRSASNNGSYGLNKLETFDFPKNTTVIPDGMFHNNHSIQKVNMWESDATNLSLFETIPDYCFQCCSNLTHVRIPEGVKYIGDNAFGGTESEPAPPIEAIHLPNTLETIGINAFVYNYALTSITIPANVTAIGNSAFQHNKNLEDVYVLGNHVITCDGSFNEEYTYNGFTYDNNNDGNGSVVSIKDWKSDKDFVKHPLRLHIPKDSEAYRYCVNPFLRALNALTKEELALIDTYNSNESIRNKLSSYGINPSNLYLFQNNWVEMDGHRYFKKPQAMFNEDSHAQNLISADIAQGNANYTDFNGWHNFMFAAGDLEEKIWEDGRLVDSRWYSAVFPFSMSYNQVITTYGVGTDVREFSYVNKHTVNDQEVRTVTFLDIPTDKDEYIKKGRPYMIHPGVRSVDPNATRSSQTLPRKIAGVDVNAAQKAIDNDEDLEVVTKGMINGDTKGIKYIEGVSYTFRGSYKGGDIPANSFFLGIKGGDISTLGFYVTRVKLEGKWSPFTSIVQKTESESTSNAKSMDLGFTNIIEEDFGITTAVENAAVLNSSNNTVVYNLSGQAVRENNGTLQGLSKGVYVVNGKKIVIR